MDQTMIIVSAVVGSLGVLSAILGFSAEGTKLTVRYLGYLLRNVVYLVGIIILSLYARLY
jgi:hypothetical protein